MAGADADVLGAGTPTPAPSLLSSLMFLDNSAARAAASLAPRSLANRSSADLSWIAPFDSVSLSGAVVAGFLSSTFVCTLPLAFRSTATTCALGAMPASFLRKSLKSLLCATMIWFASSAELALACSAEGTFMTEPALTRLILPPTNASGLLRNSATSIWSSDTLAGLTLAAILLAVSPGLTVTCRSLRASGVLVAAVGAGGGLATGAGLTGGFAAAGLSGALAVILRGSTGGRKGAGCGEAGDVAAADPAAEGLPTDEGVDTWACVGAAAAAF